MRLIGSLLVYLELELVPGRPFSEAQAGPFEPGAVIGAGTLFGTISGRFLER